MHKNIKLKLILLGLVNLFCFKSFSQTAQDIIKSVFTAQKNLKSVSYTLVRTDTLVTGDNRSMSGKVSMLVDHTDTIFGCKFRAQKSGDTKECIYDGYMGYELDQNTQTYTLITKLSRYFLLNGGGQIVLSDLVKLDTSNSIGFKLSQDVGYYYLTMIYNDIKEYNVIKRYKTVTINKKNMLPMATRQHQETLGKVQDLYYQIKEIDINDPSFKEGFASVDFLNGYTQRITTRGIRPAISLTDKEAPAFALTSFDDARINLSQLRGKVILLDFWEVWCGPCMLAMPKVEKLYETYKDKSLQVYGIVNDTKQLEPSRRWAKSSHMGFPVLIGNEQLKKDYKLAGVPLYVLIDKNGRVSFVSEGYSDELETAIKAAIR